MSYESTARQKCCQLYQVFLICTYMFLYFQLRLGNTADTPKIGDLVLSTLCPALAHIISNGMKHHLAGFQMFGRVQVTIWKVVEASVEAGNFIIFPRPPSELEGDTLFSVWIPLA